MAVSCSPSRFEAELAALRGRDGVGRGQFLIGSHIQRLCDVHPSDGGCSRTRTCDPLIKSNLYPMENWPLVPTSRPLVNHEDPQTMRASWNEIPASEGPFSSVRRQPARQRAEVAADIELGPRDRAEGGHPRARGQALYAAHASDDARRGGRLRHPH